MRMPARMLGCLSLAMTFCVAAHSQDGWVSLFDGKTLDGWTQRNGTATYRIKLPRVKRRENIVFLFGTMLTGPSEDGVRHAVLIDGQQVFRHTQTEETWTGHRLDLTPRAGQRITLTLVVDPVGNATHDWTTWVEPRIVVE